jgi:hypothetical protein
VHGHDIDGMLGDDPGRFSAAQLRLHLDNSHDERTTGWDFARLHGLHQELHGPRLAEIEAAANLTAPEPADVDALRHLLDLMADFSDNDQRARYLLSSNWMRDRGEVASRHARGARIDPDAIARGAELARAFNAAGALKMSEGGERNGETRPAPALTAPSGQMSGRSSLPDPPAGDGAPASTSLPAAPRHVWTCALKGGADTCECEAFANS